MPKTRKNRPRRHQSAAPKSRVSDNSSISQAGNADAAGRYNEPNKASNNSQRSSVVERFELCRDFHGRQPQQTIIDVLEQHQVIDNIGEDKMPRSPSPPLSLALSLDLAENWSEESREAFQTMISAPGYVNRYRLDPKKKTLFEKYLHDPSKEPLNEDGTRDHQMRYQASHWLLANGHLYRRPKSSRSDHLRRHLDTEEVWSAITAEHLRHGHFGRDKLRKALDRRYIGYSPQEIMFVLKECKRCSGRVGNEQRAASTGFQGELPPVNDEDATAAMARGSTSANGTGTLEYPAVTGLFSRKQTSNFMLYY